MKTTFLIILTLLLSFLVTAQDKIKQKEVGLVFSSFNNFGLTFKTGSNKSLWRFNSVFVSGGILEESNDSIANKNKSFGFGLRIGREYRKTIVENLEFRFGADLSFGFNKYTSEHRDKILTYYDRTTERIMYEPGMNLVLGLNYVVKDKLVIGVEFLPNFSYRTGKSKEWTNWNYVFEYEKDISGFTYGLSNNFVWVSLAYRIRQ